METLETDDTSAPPGALLYRRAIPNLDEDPSWPQLLQAWMSDYQPDSPAFEQHVLRAAQSEMLLRQEEHRFDAANTEWLQKQSDVAQWTAAQHKAYRELKWRVDDAGRTLIRCTGLCERLRRARLLERAAAERSRRGAPGKNAAPLPPALTPQANLPYLQIIIVRVEDGVTKTVYNPPNREVLDRIAVTGRAGAPVRRVLHFPQGIPPEYAWARSEQGGDDPRHLAWSLSQTDFAAEVDLEAKAGKGHVLKSKNFPVREVVLLD